MADSYAAKQRAEHERMLRYQDADDRGVLIGHQPIHMTPPFDDDEKTEWFQQKWPVKVFKQAGE